MTRSAALVGVLAAAVLWVPQETGEQAAAAQQKGTLVAFVAAEDEDRLVALDVTRRAVALPVLARLKVADGPHNVAGTPEPQAGLPGTPRYVLVTSPPAGRVTLIDAVTRRISKVFRGLAYPHDVEVSPDNRWAYVTEEHGDAVLVLSLTTRRLVRRVSVDRRPHDLAVSPDGDRIWVTHSPSQNTMTILDSSRPARAGVIGRIAGGGPTHDIAFAPDGNRVWVTYWNSRFVGAFNARRRRLLFRVSVGTLPHHVAVGARVWVTDHAAGRAFILSPRSGKRLRTLGAGEGTHHVAFGMGLAAVVSHDDGMLRLFSAGSGASRARYHVGHGLHGVALVLLP